MSPRDTSSTDALLTVRGLKKYFPIRGGILNRALKRVHAVDDVDLEVMRGETLGVVGESGCGKSTTARLLMELIEPDAGELIFDGRKVGSRELPMKEYHRQVQMVFQDSYSSLNPRLTIEDSIAFGPIVHGTRAARRSPAPTTCSSASASTPPASPAATRTSSPAASASASTSPGRWRCAPGSSSSTRPSPPSTSPSRPRSSTSSPTSRPSSASPTSSSPTTSTWCASSPTACS
jgi:ABC-type dipeptide/oligopeptide/nickel transport system ATPase component